MARDHRIWLCLALIGQSLSAANRRQQEIQAAIEARYRNPRNPVLAVQQNGIVAGPVGSTGVINVTIVDGDVQILRRWDRTTEMGLTRMFPVGEPVFISKVEVKDDTIKLFIRTPNEYDIPGFSPARFTASLTFRFVQSKKWLEVDRRDLFSRLNDQYILSMIDRVIAPAPLDTGTPAPAVQTESARQPATVSLGQTIEEVTAILGSPQQLIDLGAKKILLYKSLKITFLNGKVTDVE